MELKLGSDLLSGIGEGLLIVPYGIETTRRTIYFEIDTSF